MIIEHAIKEELLLNTNLTHLVSGRIYYVSAPQDVQTPYIVFFKVTAPREHSHDGASSLVNARFQFSVFDVTYKKCKEIAEEIRLSIQGFSGYMGGGVYVNGCFYIDEIDNYEVETKLYHLAVDYSLWHHE